MSETDRTVTDLVEREYRAGFVTDIESDTLPPGLDEDVVRFISARKDEPAWLTEWRLGAYRHWRTLTPPTWGTRAPSADRFRRRFRTTRRRQSERRTTSLAEVDPELLRTYERLGIPLHEQEALAGVAVDAVFDSVSIATTFKDKLKEAGVIFSAISEAVHTHPELVKKYLGSVVPVRDNYYAALNSAVFSDGSFVFVPKGVRCPMELSTYFRINARNTGQFERTLIIAEDGAYVSYLEGCTAPMRDENQLHAAVVELVALTDARIKYSTVQNWYPGDAEGKGGIYNFVTKRGACIGDRSHISWTQVETGSAITWKYPSVVLRGNDSSGRVLLCRADESPAAGRHRHEDDPPRPEHEEHDRLEGHQRRSRAEQLSRPRAHLADRSRCAQLHAVRFAADRRSLRRAHVPVHRKQPFLPRSSSTKRPHRKSATISSSCAEQRGIDPEKAVGMIVNGFCREVFRELPMEFAVEAGRLLEVSLEGAGWLMSHR